MTPARCLSTRRFAAAAAAVTAVAVTLAGCSQAGTQSNEDPGRTITTVTQGDSESAANDAGMGDSGGPKPTLPNGSTASAGDDAADDDIQQVAEDTIVEFTLPVGRAYYVKNRNDDVTGIIRYGEDFDWGRVPGVPVNIIFFDLVDGHFVPAKKGPGDIGQTFDQPVVPPGGKIMVGDHLMYSEGGTVVMETSGGDTVRFEPTAVMLNGRDILDDFATE